MTDRPPKYEKTDPPMNVEQEVARRMRFIHEHREQLIEVWLAKTGLSPEDAELVIVNMPNGSQRISVERRVVMEAMHENERSLVRIREADAALLEDIRVNIERSGLTGDSFDHGFANGLQHARDKLIDAMNRREPPPEDS